MEIVIHDNKELRQLSDFLSAIVVNKSLFWTLHFTSNLERMQRIGIQVWSDSMSKYSLDPEYAKLKSKRNWSRQYGVISGGTKGQATFAEGDIEVHSTGRGNVLTNISPADWKPLPGESSDWHGKNADRPFWIINKSHQFWKPGNYVDVNSADHSIWKDMSDGVVTIAEAKKSLLLSAAKSKSILKRHKLNLGSWTNSKPKGALAKWH